VPWANVSAETKAINRNKYSFFIRTVFFNLESKLANLEERW